MTESIGEILIPLELIIPEKTGTTNTMTKMSGASLFVSGAKVWFAQQGAFAIFTST